MSVDLQKLSAESVPPLTFGDVTSPLRAADLPDENDTASWFLRSAAACSSSFAVSWYLSVALHLLGYGVAAAVFYAIGSQFEFDEPDVTPLSASLSDEDIRDASAKLEIMQQVPTIDVSTQSSIQQMASTLRTADNGWIDTLNTDPFSSAASGETEGQQVAEAAGLLKIPEGGLAVTRGSFTAWTEPAAPAAFTPYLIIIEYRLPDDVSRIYLSDLSGKITGTDGHSQNIPFDDQYAYAAKVNGVMVKSGSQAVKPINNKIQLVVQVPGAQQALVRDRIRIKSKRLRESQDLTLTFQETVLEDK